VWVHGHVFRLTVPGRNLGHFLQRERGDLVERIRYIKVDAEGYDATILHTLKPLIVDNRPVIKAEVYKHLGKDGRWRLWHLLGGLGYDMYRIIDENDRPGERIDDSNLTRWAHFDIVAIPRCVGQPARRAG
jgi:hypothetical protein